MAHSKSMHYNVVMFTKDSKKHAYIMTVYGGSPQCRQGGIPESLDLFQDLQL